MVAHRNGGQRLGLILASGELLKIKYMGRLRAMEISGFKISLKRQLLYHFKGNHYPQIHSDFIPTAKKAIKEGNRGNWDKEIKMPNGITKTVGEIIEGLHLNSWIKI